MRTRAWAMRGGLDLVTPRGRRGGAPGTALVLTNYLSREDGYRRLGGWERFDGRPAPSSSNDPQRQERLRAAIGEVPGAGPVKGLLQHHGEVYALRSVPGQAGQAATPTALWRATPAGWQEVDLGTLLALSACTGGLPAVGSWIGTDAAFGEVVDAWHVSGDFAAGTAVVRVVLRTPTPGVEGFAAGVPVGPRADVAYWKAAFDVPADDPLAPVLDEAPATVLSSRALASRDLPARDLAPALGMHRALGMGLDPDVPGLAWMLLPGQARAVRLPRAAFYGTTDGVAPLSAVDSYALDAANAAPVAAFGGAATGGGRWVYDGAQRRLYFYRAADGARDAAREVDLGGVSSFAAGTRVVGVAFSGWSLPVDGSPAGRRAWLVTAAGRVEAFTMPPDGPAVHVGVEGWSLDPGEGAVDGVWSDLRGLLWAVDRTARVARCWDLATHTRLAERDIPLASIQGGVHGAVCDGLTAWCYDRNAGESGRALAYGVAAPTYRYEQEWVMPATPGAGVEAPASIVHVEALGAAPARRYVSGGGGRIAALARRGSVVAGRGGPFSTQWSRDPGQDLRIEPTVGRVAGLHLSETTATLWVLALAPGAAQWRMRAYRWPLQTDPGLGYAREGGGSFDVPASLIDPSGAAPLGLAGTSTLLLVPWRSGDGSSPARVLVFAEDGTYRQAQGIAVGDRDVADAGGVFARDGLVWLARPSAGLATAWRADGGAQHGQRVPAEDRRLPAAVMRPAPGWMPADSPMPLALLVTGAAGARTFEICTAQGDVFRVYVDGSGAVDYAPFPGQLGWDAQAGVVVAEHVPEPALHAALPEPEMRTLLGQRSFVLTGPGGSVRLPFGLGDVAADRATASGRRAVRFAWAPPGQAAEAVLEAQRAGERWTAAIATTLATDQAVEQAPSPFTGAGVERAPVRYRLPALSARAKVRTLAANFYGQAERAALYGVTGETRAFVFDGERLRWIESSIDHLGVFPAFLAEHAQHLFLGYRQGSLLWSGLQAPETFTAQAGGGEIATGAEMTGLVGGYRESLFIAGRHSMRVLKGTSAEDFAMRVLSDEMGAVEGSLVVGQRLVCLDDRGMRAADQVEAHGDFAVSTLSQAVDPLIAYYRERGLPVTAGFGWRSRSAWIVCFEGGDALCATWVTRVGRHGPYEAIEFSTLELPRTVRAVSAGEDALGSERVLFAMDDGTGRVYALGAGWSADGEALRAVCALGWNDFGAPDRLKAYRLISVESRADLESAVRLAVAYDDGRIGGQVPGPREGQLVSTSAAWDLVRWDAFEWSRQSTPRARRRVGATARNLSVLIGTDPSQISPPHVLAGVSVGYLDRGHDRRAV